MAKLAWSGLALRQSVARACFRNSSILHQTILLRDVEQRCIQRVCSQSQQPTACSLELVTAYEYVSSECNDDVIADE